MILNNGEECLSQRKCSFFGWIWSGYNTTILDVQGITLMVVLGDENIIV
jgi:hypothetical protein